MGKKRKPTQNSLEISLSFWITRKHGQISTTRECGEVQLGGLSGRARRAIRTLWQELNLENEEIMEENPENLEEYGFAALVRINLPHESGCGIFPLPSNGVMARCKRTRE